MEHDHLGEPCYAAYILGCRHPACLAASREYKIRLQQRKISGEYRDLRLRENRLRADAEQLLAVIAASPELAEQLRTLLPASDPPEPVEPALDAAQLALEPPGPAADPSANPPPTEADSRTSSPQIPAVAAVTDEPEPVEETAHQPQAPTAGPSADRAETGADAISLLTVIQHFAAGSGWAHGGALRMIRVSLGLTSEAFEAALTELEESGKIQRKQDVIWLGPAASRRAPAAKPPAAESYTAYVDPATGAIRVREV